MQRSRGSLPRWSPRLRVRPRTRSLGAELHAEVDGAHRLLERVGAHAASLLVNAPSRKAGSPNRLVVAIGTRMPVSASACLNSRTMRSRSAALESRGTRSSSCRFTPYAPNSASLRTMCTGDMGARTGSPKGSRPGLPTVHRPKVKWVFGAG
jgi:hypothetical protein